MATLDIGDQDRSRLMSLGLVSGEQIVINFHPDGFSAPPSGRGNISVSIGTTTLLNGQMALVVHLPKAFTYQHKQVIVLLDGNQADSISWGDVTYHKLFLEDEPE